MHGGITQCSIMGYRIFHELDVCVVREIGNELLPTSIVCGERCERISLVYKLGYVLNAVHRRSLPLIAIHLHSFKGTRCISYDR